tara:strand:+ start:6770 stop:7120 length:351 start_codon:yes stop_codon:yes gene_type:complete
MVEVKISKNPRIFKVGEDNKISIKEVGFLHLNDNEQITLVNENKKNYDFVKKSWGYYATPSINGRLKKEGFKTALVKNKSNKYYIMVVDNKKLRDFKNYCKTEKQKVIEWIDEKKN